MNQLQAHLRHCLILFFIGITTASAASNEGYTNAFRVSQFSIFQKGGNSFSAMATYSPLYGFSNGMGIRGDFGGSALKSSLGSKGIFALLNAQFLLSYAFTDVIALEVGGGMQYWVQNGNQVKVASIKGAYSLKERLFGFIDQIVVGYSPTFVPKVLTHGTFIGLGF